MVRIVHVVRRRQVGVVDVGIADDSVATASCNTHMAIAVTVWPAFLPNSVLVQSGVEMTFQVTRTGEPLVTRIALVGFGLLRIALVGWRRLWLRLLLRLQVITRLVRPFVLGLMRRRLRYGT